jgi:hypothetical protein
MAVESLIPVSGVLPVRQSIAPAPVQGPTRVEGRPAAAEVDAPTAPQPRNIAGGLDERAERRLRLEDNAALQRLRAELEEGRHHAEASVSQLDTTLDDLVLIRSLIQGSRDMEITAGQSANLEAQALDLAHTAGAELNVNDPDQPGIISLEGIGFQPNTLGLVAVREMAQEETPDTTLLRDQVSAAIGNIKIIRHEVSGRLEALPLPEELPTISEMDFDSDEDQANRVNNEARALEVVADIREHQVQQGEPLIHDLTPLGVEGIATLIP